MSDREWVFYLDDMISFAEKVLTYTKGLEQRSFEADEKTFDATLRKLELIGEAAAHIPDAIRATYAEIPWRQIAATRNRLIHGYLGIDNDILWNIIQHDIPVLFETLKKVKNRFPDAMS